MGTLRETENEDLKYFLHKLKIVKGNESLRDIKSKPINHKFKTEIIVEARKIYNNEVGLAYSYYEQNKIFYLEMKNTETLGRLITHLNKYRGQSIDKALDTEFQ